MENQPIHELQEALRAAFIAPFASHKWQSRRSRSHWVELEGWQDAIAGPLYSIAETGGCEYVYSRDDEYFVGVVDPVTLRRRLLEWQAKLAVGVEAFCPATHTPADADDLSYMRAIAEEIRDLVERSCRIEEGRWQAERVVT